MRFTVCKLAEGPPVADPKEDAEQQLSDTFALKETMTAVHSQACIMLQAQCFARIRSWIVLRGQPTWPMFQLLQA